MKKVPVRDRAPFNLRSISADTRAQFKEYCARRGYTMTGALQALIHEAVRENRLLPEKLMRP